MKILVILFALMVLCTGCGPAPEAVATQTAIAATAIAASWTTTPTNTPTATPTNTPTATPTNTPTATPTNTPTPTPVPPVSVASGNTKLRNGPDAAYPVAGKVDKGDQLELQARNQDGSWIEVQMPSGDKAWIPVEKLKLSEGMTGTLPIITEFLPPPTPIHGWRGDPVQTLCLALEASYTGVYHQENPDVTLGPGDSDYDDIYKEIQSYVSQLGLQSVSSDGVCHATLTVKLMINMSGAYYRGQTSGKTMYCYDGASVSGNVALASSEANLSYYESKMRPGANPETRSGCPMISRFFGESYFVALQGMRQMWGDRVLLFPVRGNQTDVVQYALQEMITLGPRGKQFVPELIKCLKDSCQPFGTDEIVRALKSITGQDFGEDAANWQQWWDKQKP